MALRRLLFVLFVLFILPTLHAQVKVDKPIEFTGPVDSDRQLNGLPDNLEPNAVLSAATEQAGSYRMAAATGATTWSIELPALSASPAAGMHVVITTPSPTAGDVSLLVNGSGPFPVVLGPGESFDASEIPIGTPLSVLFDGSSFHVLNGSVYARKPCAPGTVAVNDQFCIKPVEQAESDFFVAISNCAANGLRLCSWTEFIVACNKAGQLGIPALTGNWEWTDDAVNENGTARIAGSTACGVAGTALVSGSINRGSHCCYTR